MSARDNSITFVIQIKRYQKSIMMLFLGFLILGIVAGVLSGLFGIGGGIVMVPALIIVFGMDILDANATSLAAMLLPVGILGVISYYKAGFIDVKKSLWIAFGLFMGSFAGGEFAVNISESLLAKLYAVILLTIALSYFDIYSYFQKDKKQVKVQQTFAEKPFWAYVLVGIAAGIFAGLFGKGGGIVIVPILVSLFHFDAKAAAATSLAALQLPVGLPSVMIYANDGHLKIIYACLIAVGIVAGALLGSKIGIKLPSSIFKKVYAMFLIFAAVFMVYKYL